MCRDLAELLGQVKPPTVSQDDINRSGLEVIKSTQLGEWEKAGRISNNCVDRCLICLDDYADEDDVRVMSCRHGFHKDCVDKWMQTGKNNCPACRSTVSFMYIPLTVHISFKIYRVYRLLKQALEHQVLLLTDLPFYVLTSCISTHHSLRYCFTFHYCLVAALHSSLFRILLSSFNQL